MDFCCPVSFNMLSDVHACFLCAATSRKAKEMISSRKLHAAATAICQATFTVPKQYCLNFIIKIDRI